MKTMLLMCATCAAVSLAALAEAGEKVPTPMRLQTVDLSIKTGEEVTRWQGTRRDLWQFYMLTAPPQGKGRVLPRLLVELTGDAVEVVAVVWEDVRNPDGPGTDPTKIKLSCFVKLVKNGEARIKITPVGTDRKKGPVREYRIFVGPMPEEKP